MPKCRPWLACHARAGAPLSSAKQVGNKRHSRRTVCMSICVSSCVPCVCFSLFFIMPIVVLTLLLLSFPKPFLDGIWSQINFLLTHFVPLSILQETALLETPLSSLPPFISCFHHCCTATVVLLFFNAHRRGVTKPRLSSVISFREMCSCNGCALPASAARHRSRFVTFFMMCCSIELNFFHYLSLLVSAAASTFFY